jgi:hypothetical protein
MQFKTAPYQTAKYSTTLCNVYRDVGLGGLGSPWNVRKRLFCARIG